MPKFTSFVGRSLFVAAPLLLVCVSAQTSAAQLTAADYERALDLPKKYGDAVNHMPSSPQWIEGSHHFVYTRTTAATKDKEAGHEYVYVDADTHEMRLAFDHAKLADALTKVLKTPVKVENLPLGRLHFARDEKSFEFLFHDIRWSCNLTDYVCEKKLALTPDDDEFEGDDYDSTPKGINGDAHAKPSPDDKWLAYVENYNVVIRPRDAKATDHSAILTLSQDGSEDNYYSIATLAWSPDSKHLAVYRIQPGFRRFIYYVESSPEDQLQPKHSTICLLYTSPSPRDTR